MYGLPVTRSFVFIAAALVTITSCSDGLEISSVSNENETLTSADSASNIVAEVSSAVVRLEIMVCGGESVGAGFLVDERHIVTVAHNLAGADIVVAELGDEVAIPQLVGIDQERDIALLRTDIPMGSTYLDLEGGGG
jgi:S1-C subfamily serine protease